tara:strand:+ start:451 stop:783 length:333 start_codon:yes stop_codon:yes gene_type:complete
MAPLGLFITNLGSLGAPYSMGDTGGSVVIADKFWKDANDCELTPIPATVDFNDIWDLDGSDYMPQLKLTAYSGSDPGITPGSYPAIDEGFWEVDITTGNIKPLVVPSCTE